MGRYVNDTSKTFASDSGHYYYPDGRPCYTVIGKNGKERATTLRDARTLGLVPSVTTIIRCAAAPGLEQWKIRQALMSALTLPRVGGETEDEYLKRVQQDWQEEGRAAADKGMQIHAAIESYFRGEPFDLRWAAWVEEAAKEIHRVCGDQQWAAEKSYASGGYGGKIDLCAGSGLDSWVVDYKSKDGDLEDVVLYDEHDMQLAAYREMRTGEQGRAGILFVSRTIPRVKFMECPSDDLARGWGMFKALIDFWYAKAGLANG